MEAEVNWRGKIQSTPIHILLKLWKHHTINTYSCNSSVCSCLQCTLSEGFWPAGTRARNMGLKFLGFSVNGHFCQDWSHVFQYMIWKGGYLQYLSCSADSQLTWINYKVRKCYRWRKRKELTQVAVFHSQGTERDIKMGWRRGKISKEKGK